MKPFSGLVVDLLNLQFQKEGDAIIINHVLLKKPALHAPPPPPDYGNPIKLKMRQVKNFPSSM